MYILSWADTILAPIFLANFSSIPLSSPCSFSLLGPPHQAKGFRSLADGEDVEFELERDEVKGSWVATDVTGPDGADVHGAREYRRFDEGGEDTY